MCFRLIFHTITKNLMVNLQLTIKVEKPVHKTHYLVFDKDGSLPKNVTIGGI